MTALAPGECRALVRPGKLCAMCGRFVQTTPPERLRDALEALAGLPVALEGDPGAWRPRWNVAPRSPVVACSVDGGCPAKPRGRLGWLDWGLLPSFARDHSRSPRPHNLRAETVLERPAWRRLAERRRAVVPADAFYEWKDKLPWAFAPPPQHDGDGDSPAPLWLAALWDASGEPLAAKRSVALLTRPAGSVVGEVHDREPAVLPEDLLASWLDPAPLGRNGLDALVGQVLESSEGGALQRWRVAPKVNRVGVEGPELLERVGSD